MRFPPACPQIPVADLATALSYYERCLGFTTDWADTGLGLAGLSRGHARVFLADAAFRDSPGPPAPVVLWLNFDSRAEVDAIHAEWLATGAHILHAPREQPWRLYEFFVRDADGNTLRAFHDVGGEADALAARE